ncbi:hypothetical protein AVEN_146806-1 [Araneus ventricosus]|uniref:RNase H type-1 domain-containing protein n=1 Tax=Araneus ventricosus TaxID=182803 RepID=A0A4Y2T5X3_ARAVE|nr:hypothetical protein AVEN_146806-1 [Araneus ventricosus]
MLGVILDDQLNGLPHINQTGEKMIRILNRLTIAKHKRGLSGKVLKVLYKRTLERILVYAAPAWWTGSNAQTSKLLSIQRKVLLAVTGAFRTTSTLALQTSSGIEPLDLVCAQETAWYHIKKSCVDTSFCSSGRFQMERTLPVFLRVPSSWTLVQWDRIPTFQDLVIFTDGSKINGQVGAAFCTFNKGAVQEHQYRLDDHCSVFQAEAVAIKEAIKWAARHFPQSNCNIHTDSLSVLMALQNPLLKNDQILWIRSNLNDKIALHWVKAHIGIEGNEAADRAAKNATTKPAIDIHLGIPQNTIRSHLKELLQKEWQKRWDDREAKGRFTHAIFPSVSRTRCIFNKYDIQAVSNHGLCPQFLRRFNLRNCSCRCGEDNLDDIHHYIYRCPLLGHLRERIKPSTPILSILSHPALREEMRSLLKTVFGNERDIFQDN